MTRKPRETPPPTTPTPRPGLPVPLGRTLATPGALAALTRDDITAALGRHVHGDWGDCDAHDTAENNFALDKALRLLSVYHSARGVKFWIITEADRSATTVLLPEEY